MQVKWFMIFTLYIDLIVYTRGFIYSLKKGSMYFFFSIYNYALKIFNIFLHHLLSSTYSIISMVELRNVLSLTIINIRDDSF